MSAGVHQLHHDVDTGSYLATTHQKVGQLSLKGRASLVLSANQYCKSPKFTHCPYSGYHAIYTFVYSSIGWQLTDGNMTTGLYNNMIYY